MFHLLAERCGTMQVEVAKDTSLVMIAEGSGQVLLGALLAWLICNEVQVLDIAVRPSARRQGIATALLISMQHILR